MRQKQGQNKPKPKRTRTTSKKVQAEDARPYAVEVPQVEVRPEEDNDPIESDGLTFREKRFIEFYLGEAAGNGTRAAMMAGYSTENANAAKVTACRKLTKANVQEALAQEIARRRAAKPDWIKNRLFEIAGSSMANVASVDERGKLKIDFEKTRDNAAMGQLKKMVPRTIEGAGPGGDDVMVECKIEMHDPMPALRLLAEITGLVASGAGVAKPPEEVFFESAGQVSEKLPAGTTPPMPDDVFDLPRVQGKSQ